MALVLRLGDGFCSVTGDVIPEKITKALRYWHRKLVLDTRTYKRVAAGEYRVLYEIKTKIEPGTGASLQECITLPGFFHKLRALCEREGLNTVLCDSRSPFPEPDYAAALEGLRDYQAKAVATALLSRGGIINMPTGTGKTYVAAGIIKAYPRHELQARNTPTIVLTAPNQDVTYKNWEELKKLLPGREIGLVMTGYKDFSDDIQCITMDSLDKMNMEEVGVLIADEVHNAATEERSDLFMSARNAVRYGLSASPFGRFDGRDVITEGIFGPVVFRQTFREAIDCKAIVNLRVFWVTAPEPTIGIRAYLEKQRRNIKYRYAVENNNAYNALIGQLMRQIPESRQTLCIMPSLNQMNNLVGITPEIKYVHATQSLDSLQQSGYDHLDKIDKKERRKIYDDLVAGDIRKIYCSHIYRQGVNFPEVQVVINAGGMGSDILAQQIPGRATRRHDDKDEAYIVDFWHPWDVVYEQDGVRTKPGPVHKDDLSRHDVYEELGLEQNWVGSDLSALPFLK